MTITPHWLSRYKDPEDRKRKAAESQRKRRKANPELFRERGRVCERRRKLRKYGFTEETYKQQLEKQNNVCAICLQPNPNGRDWHVDHDHKTSKTRGILCHHCNLLLGNARDNVKILENAIVYLEIYS